MHDTTCHATASTDEVRPRAIIRIDEYLLPTGRAATAAEIAAAVTVVTIHDDVATATDEADRLNAGGAPARTTHHVTHTQATIRS